MVLFADRRSAGRELAAELESWRGTDAVILGIPRGGVVVAAEVARSLGLDLDAIVVRKLGAAGNAEYAVGAIAEGVRVVTPGAMRWAGMSSRDLERVESVERDELARRTDAYGSHMADVSGRTAIVVDDGVATGATALAACRAAQARGAARILLAVPVAPERWESPVGAFDALVCPHREADFWAVGEYYDDFRQTTDAEVVALLGDTATGSATGEGR